MKYKSLYLVLEGEAIHKAWVIMNAVSSPSLQIMLVLSLLSSARNYLLTLPTSWMERCINWVLSGLSQSSADSVTLSWSYQVAN